MSQYRLVMLAEIAFQACLIDRSSISPFRINSLRAVRHSVSQPSFKSHCSAMRFAINGFATTVKSIVVKMCQTFECRSITYGDLVQVVGGSTVSATARAYGVNGISEVITAYLVVPRNRKASSSP